MPRQDDWQGEDIIPMISPTMGITFFYYQQYYIISATLFLFEAAYGQCHLHQSEESTDPVFLKSVHSVKNWVGGGSWVVWGRGVKTYRNCEHRISCI